MVSYDFDFIDIDWDEDTFTIIKGGNEYTYSITEEQGLLSGGLNAGVPYHESVGTWEYSEKRLK